MFLCDAEDLRNSEVLITVAVIQHHINAALIFEEAYHSLQEGEQCSL